MTRRTRKSAQIADSTQLVDSYWALKPGTQTKPVIGVLTALLLLGCQPATDTPAPTSPGSGSNNAPAVVRTENDTAKVPAPDADSEVQESWEVYFIEGDRVGYGHLVRQRIDGPLVRISSESELQLQRFGQIVTQQISLTSVETPEGQLVRCASKMTQGPVTIETKAHVRGDELVLETTTLGKTQSGSIAWDTSWGGFFADQVSLQRQPMRPGEKRTLRVLVPMLHQVGQLRLEAGAHETVELLSDEQQELLRIDGSMTIGDIAIDTVIWTNDRGEAQKTITDVSGMKQVAFRTTAAVALAGTSSKPRFDLGQRTIVKIAQRFDAPHQTRRAVYRVRLDGSDPTRTFVSGSSQLVERLDERTATITVRALRGNVAADAAREDAPTDADRGSNNLIQSDDPRIIEMSRQVAVTEDDPWTLACALERYVRDTVQTKDFTQAMASAADVARSLEGDCTEHAVLLAALCRARQIPARVAIGLVYYGQASGFAYHMWNEVWIRGRWIPLDGTLGAGGIGAGHIKVTSANLDGVSPYSALLPVLSVLGKLEIKILDVDYSN